jgi:regulator of chromosome condensation
MLDVYSYGSGECDQLGLGDTDVFEAKVPKKVISLNTEINNKVYQICCGGMHTVVLTTMGKIFTWGCGDDGTLGREGIDNTPGIVDIDIPMNNICAGDSHTIAYNTEFNKVFWWGSYRVKLIYLEPSHW